MSIAMSWFAVSHKPVATILNSFTLADTLKPANFSTSKIMGARLPNDWYLIVLNEFWHPFIQIDDSHFVRIDHLLDLSLNGADTCEVVGCSEMESTNSSLAFFHRNGKQVWRVGHILDEGVDHFAIEGTLPEGFQQKLTEAIKLSQQEHYDAVYSLPARLAQEVCGFHFDQLQSLKFTELVEIPKVKGTTLLKTISARLEPLLENQGFIKNAEGDYVSISANEEITCHFSHGSYDKGGGYFDLRLEVHNHYVDAIARAFTLEHFSEEMRKKPNYRRNFCQIIGLSGQIITEEDLKAWLTQVESKLPGLFEQFRDIKTLEAVTNDGSTRYDFYGNPTLAHTDYETGCSRLILAYLAGNPKFNQMVAETDSPEGSGKTLSHDLAAYLRKNVTPLVRQKRVTNLPGDFLLIKKIKKFLRNLNDFLSTRERR